MPDFQKGKIYRIQCNSTGKNYIGSTCMSLSTRLSKHIYDSKMLVSISSSTVLEQDNFEIILIENYPCNNKDELLMRERHYSETMDCVNKHIPIRHQATIQEYQSDYRLRNKDNVKDYNKAYNEAHVKEKKLRDKSYYLKNKEKIIESHNKKFTCVCGCVMNYGSKSNHLKSPKHQLYLDNLPEKNEEN